jgi:hypothetical protein
MGDTTQTEPETPALFAVVCAACGALVIHEQIATCTAHARDETGPCVALRCPTCGDTCWRWWSSRHPAAPECRQPVGVPLPAQDAL